MPTVGVNWPIFSSLNRWPSVWKVIETIRPPHLPLLIRNRQGLVSPRMRYIRAWFKLSWVVIWANRPIAPSTTRFTSSAAFSSRRPKWVPRHPSTAQQKNPWSSKAVPTSGNSQLLHLKSALHPNFICYSDCAVKTPNRRAEDMDVAERLWKLSEQLVNYSHNWVCVVSKSTHVQ